MGMHILEIEKSIAVLSENELAEFRNWFYEFDHTNWDEKIASPQGSVTLSNLAAKALDDFNAGRYKQL